jgi:glycine/D-amino acid oxidase-like deaminating enzyme
MAKQADMVVVGAGVMGCGTAYWLSQAGYGVLVLEQEAIACSASGMAAALLESVGHDARPFSPHSQDAPRPPWMLHA